MTHDLKKNIGLSILAMIVIVYILFSGPPVGLSDNGDFDRIIYSNGLEYAAPAEQNRFIYQNVFRISFMGDTKAERLFNALFHIEDFTKYPSLQNVFVKLSIGANILVNVVTGADTSIYRIEILGLIYVFLYGLALLALFSSIRIRRQWLDIALKLIIIVILCDVGYVLYFNSFYGEALQNIFLVFSVAFGISLFHESPRKRNYILFVLSLLCFGWTKFANIPITLLVLVFLLPGVLALLGKKNRLFVVLSTSVTLVLLMLIYLSIPKWMDFQTNYNAVFFGVLRDVDSERVPEYVADLGLPPYMEELANTNYYMSSVREIAESERFVEDFSRLGKARIAFFYLRHPGYFLEKLRFTALNSVLIRPAYLSNYGPQEPRLTFCKTFELWGGLRKALPFGYWWFDLLILLATVAYFTYQGIRACRENKAKALLFLGAAFGITACVLYNFCIPYIANGEGDIAKHMFAFIQNVDFMVILLIYLLLTGISKLVTMIARMPLRKRLTAIISCGLCVVLAAAGIALLRAPRRTGMTGSFVELGEYQGKKLIWQVINEENGVLTLLASEPVANGRFSDPVTSNAMLAKYGSNLWVNSSIRTYLNEDFLKSFSEEELALLTPAEHNVLLSAGNRSLKETGDRELIWSYVPALSDRDYDDSYAMIVNDIVSLPNLRQIADMSRNGLRIRKTVPFWLDTPYYSNDSMVRVVETDGYIYMKDAVVGDIGIVPCIYISSGWAAEGKGTMKEPFRILMSGG